MDIFLNSQPEWVSWLLIAVTIYFAFIFLRQALRHRAGDIRAVFIVAGLLFLPMSLIGLFVYDGNILEAFNRGLEINQNPDNWWVIHVVPEKGNPWFLNLIASALLFSFLYILLTLLVSAASSHYFRKRGSEVLSLHKALGKWAVIIMGCALFLRVKPWPILVGMGAASIVLGLALKEMLENLFTGMTLDMEGAFHSGDWIQVGSSDTVGKVYEKNWRSTRILTLNGESITIPNRTLGSEKILSFHKPGRLFAHRLVVGASYHDPPVKVKEILRTILIRQTAVAMNPAPEVRTIEYDDFSINYEMKFWMGEYGELQRTVDSIMTQVWYSFKFYGIEIPFPIRTVHMKERDQVHGEVTAIETEVQSKVAFLQTLPFFNRHLTLKDFDFLARNSFERSYYPEEHIVQAGEIGDALFLVREGWCQVALPDRRIARLEIGEYFGEMGLLGAYHRTADVIAGEKGATVIRTDKHCMEILFRAYPDLLLEFKQIRDVRKEELPSEEKRADAERTTFVSRMIRYTVKLLRPW